MPMRVRFYLTYSIPLLRLMKSRGPDNSLSIPQKILKNPSISHYTRESVGGPGIPGKKRKVLVALILVHPRGAISLP